MNHKILDKNNQQELTSLFRSVFTSSEGEEEGNLIGNLTSRLSSGIDNQEIICFGTCEDKTIIGSIFFTQLRFNEPIAVYLLGPVAVSATMALMS
jgi:predicted N-acetyltransferase YhbS